MSVPMDKIFWEPLVIETKMLDFDTRGESREQMT